MKRYVLALVAAVAAVVGSPSGAQAQLTDSDTQTFTVTVAPIISINAPITGGVTIAHNGLDANQNFTSQTWTAFSNNGTGANVTFSITPFANGTTQRNGSLTASVTSSDAGSGWAMIAASDTSDYTNLISPNGLVTAASTATGNCTFGLSVSFIDTDYSLLPTGSYVSTVTGTITANP